MGAEDIVRVLAVSPAEEDHVSLQHIFSHSKWQIDRVRTCAEARAFLRDHEVPVIICACDLPDGDWRHLLREAGLQPIPPRLIVGSQAADDRLWAEVLNLGGYDVLVKPFETEEVVRVVSLAWRQWKHEKEQRARQPARATGRRALGGMDLRRAGRP